MKNKYLMIVVTIIIIGIGIFTYYENQKYNKEISGTREKIYVAIEGSGEIAVINASTNRMLRKIDLSEEKNNTTIGYMPHNVQVAPDNKSVWVTANAIDKKNSKMSLKIIPEAYADSEMVGIEGIKDAVIVIDPFSDEIIKRIELGSDLHLSHVSLTQDNSYAIVASQEKGILYKINAKTFMVEKKAMTQDGAQPHGLRIAPDSKTAYIAMLGGKSIGVLDIEKMNLTYVALKGSVVQTGVTSDGKYALASVYETKSLAVYNIVSSRLDYIDLPKEAKGPVQIYPTPDSRYVYVADQGYYFEQPTGDTVYKIDLKEMKVVSTIKAGSAPHGVVVSKGGEFVYITNLLSDDVSVIDTALEKEVAKIKVGKMPNGISLWYGEKPKNSGGKVISESGLHWHSELAIYVKGEKLSIPANIGLSAIHNPVHTHDEDASAGVIHMEFEGIVRKSDTVLGEFFKSWDKDIRSIGPNMKMTVNGVENTEYENYEMKDGDKIELRYE